MSAPQKAKRGLGGPRSKVLTNQDTLSLKDKTRSYETEGRCIACGLVVTNRNLGGFDGRSVKRCCGVIARIIASAAPQPN